MDRLAPSPSSPARPASRELSSGLAAGALVVAIWSAFLVVSRAGVLGSLVPTDIAGLRIAVGLLATLPIFARFGLAGLPLRRAAVLVATAGLGFPLLAYHAFAHAPAAHGAVLMPGTLPLWTALLARLVLGEPFSRRRVVSLLAVLAGVGALASGIDAAPPGALVGDLLFPAASLSWAIFTVAARAWRVPPIAAVGVVGFGAGLVFLPIWIVLLPKGLAQTPWPELVFHGAYHGLFAFLVAFVAYTRCLVALGPGPTTMITALVPGVGALLAVPILGEPLTLATVAGLGLVTAGMLVTVRGLRPAGSG